MAIVGPGSVQQNVVVEGATLDGASEYEFVEILNPLSDDFAIAVAQSRPVNLPFKLRNPTPGVQNESDLSRNFALTLKNPDHTQFASRAHIQNTTVIKSGATLRLPGNEAQVAVRQLVNEILQREGNRRLLADPALRKVVEDRIIIRRGSIQDLMDGKFKTAQSQIQEAINRSNEVQDEPFPGLRNVPTTEDATGSADIGSVNNPPQKRTAGRPKRVVESTNTVQPEDTPTPS